jgi:hypothetical protein
MSKKNKSKGSNKGNSPKQPQLNVAKSSVSSEVVKSIDELKESAEQKIASSGLPIKELDEASSMRADEAEKSNDVRGYLKDLRDIHRMLFTLKTEAEKDREAAEKILASAKDEKQELESAQTTFKEKEKLLNERERDVHQRELQIDNGEYSGTIRSLLATLSRSEKEIADETQKILEDLSSKLKELLHREQALSEIEINFEEEKLQLEKEKKRLARKERNIDADMEIFKEETRADLEREYTQKYADAKARAERLQARNDALEQNIERLEKIRTALYVTFGEQEPEVMLESFSKIKAEIASLKEQLYQRPTEEDLETQRKENADLLAEVNRLKDLVNEKEITELRTFIQSSDSYVIEIQGYKDRLESSKNREDSLRRTIEDLKSTVEQLKGEHQKDEEAFQFCRKYDSSPYIQNASFRNITPQSLRDFAIYMQRKIASSADPFYYDIDTIRTFIAGLNMSNISILQGISGTGKTSLPREFAKCLISAAPDYNGNSEDNSPNAPYRICAVQSGWRDNMDLMGYYNSFEHKYKETEFFKALYLANQPKYRDCLFFIILDEMNLSSPEHYFADFLSLLEQKPEERYIVVNAPDEVLPKSIVQGKLQVPENIRFIGTANHDETTLEFAPKTYDRSNLMEMPKNQLRNIPSTEQDYNVSYSWLKRMFAEAKDRSETYYKKFKEFIDSDEVKLLLADKGIGVGNRFEDQAERFISAFIATGDTSAASESLAKAADHLITTRLLRTLKNRIDIEENSLKVFRDEFEMLFKNEFGFKPTKAIELLNSELSK